MNLKNCKKCGKMFNYIMGEPVCPACKERDEITFKRVKTYVQENKRATIPEIVENCEVDAKQVKQWVREERLVFADDSPVKINCESCGTQISTGRFCAACKKNTLNNFGNASRSMQAQQAAQTSTSSNNLRMHTFKN